MPRLIFTTICLFWGTSYILMKTAKQVFNAQQISIGRLICGFVALLAIWLFFSRTRSFNTKDVFTIALFAPFAQAIPFTLQPYLMGSFDSNFIGTMVCLVPLLTILVSIPMLKTKPSRNELLGVMGGLACMAWLFYDKIKDGASFKLILLAAITPTCFAYSNTFVKKKLTHISSIEMSAISSLFSIFYLLLWTSLFAPLPKIPYQQQGFSLSLAALLILGFACTGFANFIYYKLIHLKGPLYAGMVTYLIPIIAMFWGYLDGEIIKPMQFIPIAGCLLMIGLVQSSKSSKVRVIPQPTEPIESA